MKKDYSAVKFEVSEELGEWMNCLYLKRKENQEWTHCFIHHTQCDGVGGITKILEQEGHTVIEQPKTRPMPKMNFFKKFGLLKKFINLTKSVDIKWKYERRDIKGIPPQFCLNLLSQQQTKTLHERAQQEKVSLNSWLFFNLDLACLEILLEKDSDRKWVSPINIRTSKEKLYGNHSASIILNFLHKDHSTYSAGSLHDSIKNYLKSNLHWGSYLYSNMARLIGKKGTLKVAKKVKEVGTGVFSNLGTWPNSGIEHNDQAPHLFDRRAVLAPVTQVLPVAATSWQWQQSLSLSVQLHPSLNTPDSTPMELMKKWSQLIGLEGELQLEVHTWRDYPECPTEKIVPPLPKNQ